MIDNRGGAGGNIGAELAARAAPDGYTIVLGTNAHAINMSLLATREIKEQFLLQGVDPMPLTPDQFGGYIAAEIDKWGKVVKASKAKVD